MLRRERKQPKTTRIDTTVLAKGSNPMVMTFDPSSETDIAVIEGRLAYDFKAELGERFVFTVTAINRGGKWER